MFLLLSRVTGAGDLNLFAKEIMDRSCAKIREHKFCINDVQNLDDGSGSFFFFFFFLQCLVQRAFPIPYQPQVLYHCWVFMVFSESTDLD